MKTASSAEPTPAPGAASSRSLWLWVAGAFCMMLLAWVVLFKVAHSANVERVPLATKGGRP